MHVRILYSSPHNDEEDPIPIVAEQDLRRSEGVYIGILGGMRQIASNRSITPSETSYRVNDVQAFTLNAKPAR
jgi:hypothetical protein